MMECRWCPSGVHDFRADIRWIGDSWFQAEGESGADFVVVKIVEKCRATRCLGGNFELATGQSGGLFSKKSA